MDVKTVLDQAEKVAKTVAFQYHQDASDLLSYCSVYIPGLIARVDTTRTEKSQLSFIKRSLRGYFLHAIRDSAPLIKTPRGAPKIAVSAIHENIKQPTPELDELPEWALDMIDHKVYGKRLANALLHHYYS